MAPKGGPVRSANFRTRVWQPAVAAAGLGDLTFHELRHTAAGLLIQLGAHPKVIQQRMRHRSIRTTLDVYGHVLRSVDEQVTTDLEGLFADAPRGARGALASGHDTAGEPHQP